MIRWIVLLACVGYAISDIMNRFGPGVFPTKDVVQVQKGFGPFSKANSLSSSKSSQLITEISGKKINITLAEKIVFSGIAIIVKRSINDVGPYSIIAGWGNFSLDPTTRIHEKYKNKILNAETYATLEMYSNSEIVQSGLRNITENSSIKIVGQRATLSRGEKTISSNIKDDNKKSIEVIWVNSIQLEQKVYR